MEALARPLIFANLAAIWLYIVLWQGAQRFFFESFATWIISPVIYTRICPEPFRATLLRTLVQEPMVGHLLCAIPVAMFLVSLGMGIVAYRRRSFPVAVLACFLMSAIFVVYHSLKHLGMRVEYI